MMNFPPAHSLESMARSLNHGDFDASTSHIIRSTQTKKKKKQSPPLENFSFYINIGITPDGRIERRCSKVFDHLVDELIQHVSETISQLAPVQRFDGEHLTQRPQKSLRRNDDNFQTDPWQVRPHCSSDAHFSCDTPSYTSQMASKRRRMGSPSLRTQDVAMSEFEMNPSFATTHVPASASSARNANSSNVPIDRPQIGIRLDDEKRWLEWLEDAFAAIQQQACRFIAKEWIKAIQPKKQSTNPYNGNYPRDQKADPEKTRPKYWPRHVQHREPDHINKGDRIKLLIHLLMNTPQEVVPNPGESGIERNFLVAQDFLDTLEKKKDELKDKWEIIEGVMHARTQLEQFKDGCYDAETIVNVRSYQDQRAVANGKKQRTKSKADTKAKPKADTNAISSSNEIDEMYAGSPTPPASPTDFMPTPDASEQDDDMAALTASFSSTVTQKSTRSMKSTRSTVPILRPKPTKPSNTQSLVTTQPMDQHSILAESEQAYNGALIKQRDHMHPAWAAGNMSAAQMHGLFDSGAPLMTTPAQATDNAYFTQQIYDMPNQVMHESGTSMCCYPSQHYPCHYGHGMNGGQYLEDMSDIHGMNPSQSFQLHDEYLQAQAQAQAQHSHH